MKQRKGKLTMNKSLSPVTYHDSYYVLSHTDTHTPSSYSHGSPEREKLRSPSQLFLILFATKTELNAKNPVTFQNWSQLPHLSPSYLCVAIEYPAEYPEILEREGNFWSTVLRTRSILDSKNNQENYLIAAKNLQKQNSLSWCKSPWCFHNKKGISL